MDKLIKQIIGIIGLLLLSWHIFATQDIRIGMVLEPPHLDPTGGAAGAIDEIVYANVFEGLTGIDEHGKIQPLLAKTWHVSKNASVFKFELQQGVTFHDGTKFTANDVQFSFNRAASPKSSNPQKAIFENIKQIDVTGKYAVTITLKEPRGNFLYKLGFGDAVIVSSKTAKTNKSKPVGTGPFTFGKYQKGGFVKLNKNKSYWGKAPAIDSILFRFISDPNAARNALLSGDVDAFPNFPAPELIEQFKQDKRFDVFIGNTEGETILAINNQKPPFDNINVRRALSHAIDKSALLNGAMFGIGSLIGSHFSPASEGYIDLNAANSYNPKLAKQLLAEAGIKKGLKMTLKLPPPNYARRSGELIAAMLLDVGIQTEIIPVEWAQWLDEVYAKKQYDLTIVSHTEPQDIDIYARANYYFNYQNPAFNEVISKLSVTSDSGERIKMLKKAQQILSDDAVNVFLFLLPKNGIWRKYVKGMWKNSPVQANDMTGVYLEKK